MLIKNDDVLKVLGKKIKHSRLSKKYTQEYVAENIDISIDLLRNIENGRNIVFYSASFVSFSFDKIAVKFTLPCSSISVTLTVTLSPT